MPTAKTVTFGGVVSFPQSLPSKDNDLKNVKDKFNCGTLRNSLKLMGSRGSQLIAIRLIRSKLRKREETSTVTVGTEARPRVIQESKSDISLTISPPDEAPPFFYMCEENCKNSNNQFNMCNASQDTLVNGMQCEEVNGDCKGFHKTLRGQWKRLVTKKHPEAYTIPAEFKDQLKQIYVY